MKQEAFQRAKDIEVFINAHKAAIKNLTHELKYIKDQLKEETEPLSNDDDSAISALKRAATGNHFEHGFNLTGIRLSCTGNTMGIEPKFINHMYLLQILSHEAKIAAYKEEFDRL